MSDKHSNNKLISFFKSRDLDPEKIYLFLIIFIIFISLFVIIPSDQNTIGISSPVLGIGDRVFYIDKDGKGFGYAGYSGNILYPYFLRTISFITSLFNQDQFSKLWNIIIILITSLLSIISLKLLRTSSTNLFNKSIGKIASFLFIINPYNYFYCLSGGITNFLIIGVSYILYLFSKRLKKDKSNKNHNRETIYISLVCCYLSFLRPSGAIFGLIILIFLFWESIKSIVHNQSYKYKNKFDLVFVILGLFIVTYNITLTLDYSLSTVELFANEGGQFFGYPRNYLREQLTNQTGNIFTDFKHSLYFITWKITDFVSGLSDIRDTHTQVLNKGIILPFIFRTFTGIFILFPINLFSFLGIISNLKFIMKSQIWIVIISAFIAVSPSLIGISMSRYLMMFYSPFIVFSAKMIHDTFLGVKQNKI